MAFHFVRQFNVTHIAHKVYAIKQIWELLQTSLEIEVHEHLFALDKKPRL